MCKHVDEDALRVRDCDTVFVNSEALSMSKAPGPTVGMLLKSSTAQHCPAR